MNPFLPPRTNYAGFYDEARFNLTWKLNIFIFLIDIPLVITAVFFPMDVFLAVLFGWLVPFVYLVVLYATRKYKVLALLYVIMGTISTGGLMTFVETDFHVVEMTYMVMITLYAFITLGKTGGILSIAGHSAWMIYYFAFGLNRDILRSDTMDMTELAWASANFLLAFSMVGFLILEFINLNRSAEKKYEHSTNELRKSNSIAPLGDRERSAILQETHYRVKNNLQVITGLLRLQSHEIKDEKAQQQFEDAINRVIAMSMIHEKMHQSHDFSSSNLEEYLTSLSQELIESFALKKPVTIVVESSLSNVAGKVIVPLSLLFNELISNSLKHAFAQQESGKITINIHSLDEHQFEVLYTDNGRWIERASPTGFGTELIKILTNQLYGEFERDTGEQCTRYTFRLKNVV